jgi:transposase
MTSKVSALLRAPGVVDPGRVDDAGTKRPDPEVPERAKRRAFTATYKLKILAEYDAAPEGAKGRAKQLRANAFHARTITEIVLEPHPGLRCVD